MAHRSRPHRRGQDVTHHLVGAQFAPKVVGVIASRRAVGKWPRPAPSRNRCCLSIPRAATPSTLSCARSLPFSTLCSTMRLAECLVFHRCVARAREALRLCERGWAQSVPTSRAAHVEPRLVARGRRHEERGRRARPDGGPRSAASGATSGRCMRPHVLWVVGRARGAAVRGRVCQDTPVEPLSSV